MSQSYFFHDQAGSIPGVPGTFAHCRVDIDDQGTITTSSSLVSAEPEGIIEQATVVQEQENEPAPDTHNGG